ncbi:MAG: alpha/beta fold hydrolase [Steroidobacteraceae bacterium]
MATDPSPQATNLTESQKLDRVDREFRAALAKLTGGLSPADYGAAWLDWWLHLTSSPAKQAELAQLAMAKATDVMTFMTKAVTGQAQEAPSSDRRFADPAWQKFPFNVYARAFQNGAEFLRQSVTDVDGVSERSADLMGFVARNITDAVSPANYLPTNPQLLQQTQEEKGANLARGYQHFVADLKRTLTGGEYHGTGDFRVGEKLAVTPGKVVYRNDLMELIQYSPTTPDVHAEPIVFLPAWIMKYYILDLSPHNSLYRWLIENGYTVFTISWKNPTAADRERGMDDYVRLGVYEPLDVISRIMPGRPIHAAGYCIGGTLLMIAAAALAKRGDTRIKDITLFAAQTDFSEPGELSLFISPSQLAMLEAMMFKEGVLDSTQMGGAFALLRAHDLLWQPAVNAYVKGQRDKMIDLMAWNADATRMPWKMHTEYLYGLYLRNDLAHGRFKVEGEAVNLADIRVPVFAVGTETDHVAPWPSVFKVDRLVSSDEVTLLLTNGGHNAGIVSGPSHPKRHHRILTRRTGEPSLAPDKWVHAAPRQPGSWWPAWLKWLDAHSTAERVAPPRMGAPDLPLLGDAPGDYVRQK